MEWLKKSKHEGIKYPCDQCEYVATRHYNLKQLKQFKHEIIRYPYYQCEYFVVAVGRLNMHNNPIISDSLSHIRMRIIFQTTK